MNIRMAMNTNASDIRMAIYLKQKTEGLNEWVFSADYSECKLRSGPWQVPENYRMFPQQAHPEDAKNNIMINYTH